MSCTMFTDLRAGVDPEPICTDASLSGGGSCVGSFLNPDWSEFWKSDFLKASDNFGSMSFSAAQA
eukprot:7489473-Karenia_brevis.AAC.1